MVGDVRYDVVGDVVGDVRDDVVTVGYLLREVRPSFLMSIHSIGTSTPEK